MEENRLLPLKEQRVAILGYGNQGRAHALNLRDSGIQVVVGAEKGRNSFAKALEDGFEPVPFELACQTASIVMFLLPDTVIPRIYQSLIEFLPGKTIGFAHGFALHFGFVQKLPECGYFLVGPKGAGAILRARYEAGSGLPGVYATEGKDSDRLSAMAMAYASGIGCDRIYLKHTTFQEETECDLFGEQVVLCGGLMELMEQAFEVLAENGHDPEMAFFECCYEAKLILELWLAHGPVGMSQSISPTAFYGGATRGKRVLGRNSKKRFKEIFREIRSGQFAEEWMAEAKNNSPTLKKVRKSLQGSVLEATYQVLKERGVVGSKDKG